MTEPSERHMAEARTGGTIIGRLAPRPWQEGDPLPTTGSQCLVSGVHCDVESDQHRAYSWRTVVGYGVGNKFICLQTNDCWPTVERTENCWFAEVPAPLATPDLAPAADVRAAAMLVQRLTSMLFEDPCGIDGTDIEKMLVDVGLIEQRAATQEDEDRGWGSVGDGINALTALGRRLVELGGREE